MYSHRYESDPRSSVFGDESASLLDDVWIRRLALNLGNDIGLESEQLNHLSNTSKALKSDYSSCDESLNVYPCTPPHPEKRG